MTNYDDLEKQIKILKDGGNTSIVDKITLRIEVDFDIEEPGFMAQVLEAIQEIFDQVEQLNGDYQERELLICEAEE